MMVPMAGFSSLGKVGSSSTVFDVAVTACRYFGHRLFKFLNFCSGLKVWSWGLVLWFSRLKRTTFTKPVLVEA